MAMALTNLDQVSTEVANLDDSVKQRALKAYERCSRWLADGNEYNEAGREQKANECYEKSQFWLDRYNKLIGSS
jgi:hypothetical protein